MPVPFDEIFRDATTLPSPPASEMSDRSRFDLEAWRAGHREVEQRYQVAQLQPTAYKPIVAGLRNLGFELSLSGFELVPPEEALPLPRIISRFYFKPTSYSSVGANRWSYAGYRVVPHPTDVGFYTQDTVPNQDDPPEVPLAYNAAEFDNDGEGIEQAGIDVDNPNYVSCNLGMLPVKIGVYQASRWLLTGGELRVWFHATNDHEKP